MPKLETISMRELSMNAERIATDIDSSGRKYRIKRRGHRTLVLIDEGELQLLEESIDFMFENPQWQDEFNRLARNGRTRIGLDDGPSITLEQFLRDRGLDADGRRSPNRRKTARPVTRRRAPKAAGRSARTRARASWRDPLPRSP